MRNSTGLVQSAMQYCHDIPLQKPNSQKAREKKNYNTDHNEPAKKKKKKKIFEMSSQWKDQLINPPANRPINQPT